MRAVIQEVAEVTRVRDRKGEIITSFKGKLFTSILRLFIIGLTVVFATSFIALIFALIERGI